MDGWLRMAPCSGFEDLFPITSPRIVQIRPAQPRHAAKGDHSFCSLLQSPTSELVFRIMISVRTKNISSCVSPKKGHGGRCAWENCNLSSFRRDKSEHFHYNDNSYKI